MAADADLPVWTIRPNWQDGITERLEWLTDVIGGPDGTEQRIAKRLSPRREFEVAFSLWDEARSYFDLWLHRLVSQEFMVPLWVEFGKLSAGIAANATVVPCATGFMEVSVGEMVVLIGDTPQSFDARTVQAVNPNSIVLTAGVGQAWPKGTKIFPLRRCRLSDESQLQAMTNRVGQASLVFQLNQANDLADEGDWSDFPEIDDLPVMTLKPNYSEEIDLGFVRNAEVVDNDHGLRYLYDNAGRAFTTQAHDWQLCTRADKAVFRQMLYRLRGKQNAVWLPTFNQDIRLARAAAAADTALHVRKIGYAYTGGAVDGRTRVLLAGEHAVRINGTGAALAAGEERLNLAAAVGADLGAGTKGSFLDAARLDQDSIEIHHHTDAVAECKAVFRSFKNTREVPDTIYYPIADAVMSAETCGEPGNEEGECVNLPNSFDGWYWEITYRYGWQGGENLIFPFWFVKNLDTGEQYSGAPDVIASVDGWLFKFRVAHDWAPGSNVRLQLQFPFGYRRGDETVYQSCPSDPDNYVIGLTSARYYTEDDLTLKLTTCSFSISPMGMDIVL